MLDSGYRFDESAGGVLRLSANLLRWVTGNTEAGFQRAREKAQGRGQASPADLLSSALELLVDADFGAAANCSANIGNFLQVAKEMATWVSANFPEKTQLANNF